MLNQIEVSINNLTKKYQGLGIVRVGDHLAIKGDALLDILTDYHIQGRRDCKKEIIDILAPLIKDETIKALILDKIDNVIDE